MSADAGIKKTVMVALGVCLVCSVLVSVAAVGLGEIQEANKKKDKIKNILKAGGLYEEGISVEDVYKEKIKPIYVDMETGEILEKDFDAEILSKDTYNVKDVASDPEYGKAVSAEVDIAQVRRIPKYMLVYEVMNGDQVDKFILPIYGYGLWSTMYGFIALSNDLQTVKGITFYEHGETPGLGGEIENPKWQSTWEGKKALDENLNVTLEVIKGKVDQSGSKAKSQIDGLSGATITTRGVDATVKFWLGENGYGPFLNKLRKDGENV
ncbi:MAG: Na(+)-translocating NADH-quinone reductase subunit C [Ignavibacteria bacterium]